MDRQIDRWLSYIVSSSISFSSLLLSVWCSSNGCCSNSSFSSSVNSYINKILNRKFPSKAIYHRSQPLSWDFMSTFWRLFWGGRLNGRYYFSVKKSSHREKNFSVLAAIYTLGLDLDANGHQSLFWFKSMRHGVKIEVKQVDDNYTWLYNENQYLYVELSYFCNYG